MLILDGIGCLPMTRKEASLFFRLGNGKTVERPNGSTTTYTFDSGNRLTTEGTLRERRLSGLVKRYLTRTGIQGKGACHIFRHTLATHPVDAGVEVAIVQESLGHENRQTT